MLKLPNQAVILRKFLKSERFFLFLKQTVLITFRNLSKVTVSLSYISK